MGRLMYSTTMSLDGHVADTAGSLDWSTPSEEVFAVHLARCAEVSTEVLGRRTYEMMTYWEVDHRDEWTPDEAQFAREWQRIEKVVASSTMADADLTPGGRARLVDELTLDGLRRIVDSAEGGVEIFGPTTASAALRAGMVDEMHLFVAPVVLGGGLRAFPDGARLDLRLAARQEFGNGTVHLTYVRG
ncbi:MAG: dihydrofolate reductase family protein [Nocardioides sp.]|uniref:dihydrofolate reductase family protein n=1 Tax=Nocardioides sp. TaxID=35761 RepID=UPI003F1180AB